MKKSDGIEKSEITKHDAQNGSPMQRLKTLLRKNLSSDLALLIAMILGIAAKNLWDHINQTGKIGINVPAMIGAFVLAPMIYLVAIGQLPKRRTLSLVSFFIAFQYGFFWQSVFENVKSNIT